MGRKKLIDYIMEGGIKKRFFIGNSFYDDDHNLVHAIYRVLGKGGVEDTIPKTLLIKINYLGNCGSSKHEEYLGDLLEDEEATKEEIAVAKQYQGEIVT